MLVPPICRFIEWGGGFAVHQSIVWAAIHGFFGWFYVAYFALTRPGGLSG